MKYLDTTAQLLGLSVGWLAIMTNTWRPAAIAQVITAAPDGTGTIVTQAGETFNITSGSFAADSTNQFHSFQQFGLNAGQTANFIAPPQTVNIVGRVTGGNASIINGLIQVSGANANLYLTNPSGLLLGPNAQLNVPASFAATTATRIGFAGGWFDAIQPNSYADLVGNPNAFAFDLATPAAIANAGELVVTDGHTLSLSGGTIANPGIVSGNPGDITIAAVPGESIVRLSQTGMVLSLELNPNDLTAPDASLFAPQALANLLTGGDPTQATGLAVQTDGAVILVSNNTPIPSALGDGFTADIGSQGAVQIWAAGNVRTGDITTRGGAIALSGQTVTTGNLNTFNLDSSNDGTGTVTSGSGGFGSSVPQDLRFPDASGDVTIQAEQSIQTSRVLGQNLSFTSISGNIDTRSLSSEAGENTAPSPEFSGVGSTVDLTATQGTITVRGVIRAGQTNKATDSQVNIVARRFLGLDPIAEIQSDVNGDRIVDSNGNPVTVPMSIYVYPANVDAAPNNRFDANGNLDLTQGNTSLGQITIDFSGLTGGQTLGGTGNILVSIIINARLENPEDTVTFAVTPSTGVLDDSGTLGIIGIGSERAPSAIVLVENNVFTARGVVEPPVVVVNNPLIAPTQPTPPATPGVAPPPPPAIASNPPAIVEIAAPGTSPADNPGGLETTRPTLAPATEQALQAEADAGHSDFTVADCRPEDAGEILQISATLRTGNADSASLDITDEDEQASLPCLD